MFANLTGWHMLIVLAVILLLFGATRLPALSKSLGQSMRIFRSETKAMKEDERAARSAASDPSAPEPVVTSATADDAAR